jgi:hypothetical protein
MTSPSRALEGAAPRTEDASAAEGEPDGHRVEKGICEGGILERGIVEELTDRLPASELVKIIKNALECGRRNVPFTERELWRATAVGASLASERSARQGVRRR